MIELKGKYNKDCKIFIDDVEYEALSTIHAILDSIVSENLSIRIMPDVHQGSGIVIGFSMPLGKMISPLFVGTDIGCGVSGGFFKSSKPLNLIKIDELIRSQIPMGFNINKNPKIDIYPFSEVQPQIDFFVKKFNLKFNSNYEIPQIDEKWLKIFLKKIKMDSTKFWNSLSSLGSGNHYIELAINELGEYLIAVHSGSRNLGQLVCTYHVNQSKLQTNFSSTEYSKKLDEIRSTTEKSLIKYKIDELRKQMNIGVNKEYLQGEYLFNYLIDMIFTQHYASLNRKLMLEKIGDILKIDKFDKSIETIHNYVDFNTEDFMIRKGAISAKKDEICLIPISQKFGTFLVKAKGNKDWNETLCHGAGRTMSRSEAKNKISVDKVKISMKGIVCRINENVVDESEFCYKKPDVISKAIEDNAEILSTYKPILNLKDIGESESWKDRKEREKKEKSRDLNRREMRKMKGR